MDLKKGWINVYISLGSNSGNRKKNILKALQHLKENPKIVIKKSARFYETSPVGPKQRPFLNSAIKIQTHLSPLKLLSFLKMIENKMKRKKIFQWGPRNIDCDIIVYGRRKIQSKIITIPHPEFHKRKFVLVPLSEICPNLQPRGFKKTVAQLRAELTDPRQKVKLIK